MYLTIGIIVLVVVVGFLAYRALSRKDLPVEPTHVIQSGKDRSWTSPVFSTSGAFFIKPWLQPGLNGTYGANGGLESMQILFHVLGDKSTRKEFMVEIELASTGEKTRITPDARLITVHGVPEQVQFSAKVENLPAGALFKYRVLMGGREIYSACATARKAIGSPFRAIIFGDMGNGSPGQRKLAYQLGLPRATSPAADSGAEVTSGNVVDMTYVKPQGADIIISAGDVVYQHGRYAEYLSKFFAVYQAENASPDKGSNILASTVSLSCVGNHDMAKLDPETQVSFDDYPDLMAFFALWSLPLNGPNNSQISGGSGRNHPPLLAEANYSALRDLVSSAGERYPRMANFVYEYGNAHFLFLDANSYMDWTDEGMRRWVEDDLKSVAPGMWKIVVLHQPPFTSNIGHQREQGMRFLSDIFERNGVSVVFAGHAHAYERSFPIKFVPSGGIKPAAQLEGGYIPGKVTLDRKYDGVTNTRPDGVIYIVTGGGGAKLDSKLLHGNPNLWQPFTDKLVGDRHSFSLADFSPEKMEVVQYDADGNELDRFAITR